MLKIYKLLLLKLTDKPKILSGIYEIVQKCLEEC